jgi:hypothetical protein
VNRVFILGAGFSKAINERMPLLSELGKHVRSDLESKGVNIGSELDAIEDVEQWLTLLAEPTPWLGASDRARNTALFIDVSWAIYNVVMAMQVEASINSPPDWLIPLVRHWHDTEATVITFNYDYLVELAYLGAMPAGGTFWGSDVYAIPVSPAVLRIGGAGRQIVETFDLLKLHGSLDWWYSGPDAEQADPIYWLGWTGRFNEGTEPLWPQFGHNRLTADKVPMLIPPAATKSPFYRNKLLAAQWSKAAEALGKAEELVLMGYSAPATDLTVSTLIATQFKGEAIVPVNTDPEIIKRARGLGNRSKRPRVEDSFIVADAIEKWVRTFAPYAKPA